MRYETAWYVLGKNNWLRVAEKITEEKKEKKKDHRERGQLVYIYKRSNYEVLGKHIKRFGHHQKSLGINTGFQSRNLHDQICIL